MHAVVVVVALTFLYLNTDVSSLEWCDLCCVVLWCVVLWSLSVCSDTLKGGLLQQTGPFVLGLPFVCLLQQRVVSCVHDAITCLAP